MKKLLALILLSPLAHSEVAEYYCEGSNGTYFTLKIDDDVNNPSFVIENTVDGAAVGRGNLVADTNNIKVMPLTIFVAVNNGRFGYSFNRATTNLTYLWWRDGNKKSKEWSDEDLKNYKEFVRSDSTTIKSQESIYSEDDYLYPCQPYKSNKP